MKQGAVPASFLAITRVFSAEPNLALLEACQQLGVDPKDTPQVAKVWEAITTMTRKG